MHTLFRSFLFHIRFFLLAPILSFYAFFKTVFSRKQKTGSDTGKDIALFESKEGIMKCVGCRLCELSCPAQAIIIGDLKEKQGNLYPEHFDIDMTKCITCGLCEQACPEDAIGLVTRHRLSTNQKEKLYYTKEILIENGHFWKKE